MTVRSAFRLLLVGPPVRSIGITFVPADIGKMIPTGSGPSQENQTLACVNCTRRKVKCDKVSPICGSCIKTRLSCAYPPPPPARRKRKLTLGTTSVKVRDRDSSRIEVSADTPAGVGSTPQYDQSPHQAGERGQQQQQQHHLWASEPSPGTLLVAPGRSRYINSSHWQHLGDDEVQHLSEELDHPEPIEDTPGDGGAGQLGFSPAEYAMHPLTAAFMGFRSGRQLLEYHPSHADAMALCKIHCDRVEPLCKILHIPSTWVLLRSASQQPALASPADECLLFAIYHFAVFAMTDEECTKLLKHSRNIMRARFAFAVRQALDNAAFLQATTLSVLQALVLFLLAGRDHYDPHTYWIMTGVAMRIGQRMGLHKDGESLGLPPFEVQMRRRLYYQLLPLDGIASKMAGVSMMIPGLHDTLDTKIPSNVNDDQLWPQMTEGPMERKDATEMSFCLARMCIATFFAKTSVAINRGNDLASIDSMIVDAESEVQDRFIRYCDMVNPLHILTAVMARSAVSGMRIRARLPKLRANTITAEERKELIDISIKILDADATAYLYPGMKGYMWHLGSFFLYGSWDSFIYVITALRRPDLLLLSTSGIDDAWSRIEQTYTNHPQLFELQKQPLHAAAGRLCLKAWDANPPSLGGEANFITTLREVSTTSRIRRERAKSGTAATATPSTHTPAGDANALLNAGLDADLDSNFNLDNVDWEFWDQLISDHVRLGG